MRCPYCQNSESKVLDTTHDSHGGIRRRRECLRCGQRFSSYERAILSAPLLVKQDGTREEFDREKLARGIRISCAKRPVSAADIERLVEMRLGVRDVGFVNRRQIPYSVVALPGAALGAQRADQAPAAEQVGEPRVKSDLPAARR